MAALLITGLLSVTLVSVAGEMTYERCYLVESRNECFFYPLNWKTSWKWAQTFCSDHGGKLVSVYSAEMQKAVSRFAETVKFGGEDIWISARRQSQDWTWVNDVPLTGIKVWNQSQSSDFRVKAAVTKHNTIEARHPGNELPYVCQYNVDSARCKETSNYFEERSSCFVFYSDEFLTWYDARNRCLKKGGDLATFVNVDSSVGVGKLAKSPHWI